MDGSIERKIIQKSKSRFVLLRKSICQAITKVRLFSKMIMNKVKHEVGIRIEEPELELRKN